MYNVSVALTPWPSHLMPPSAVFRELGIVKDYMYRTNVPPALWPSRLMSLSVAFRELRR